MDINQEWEVLFSKINELGITDVITSFNYVVGKYPTTGATAKKRGKLACGYTMAFTTIQLQKE